MSSAFENRGRALGGAQLVGNRVVRFVYMDETGTNKTDTHTVVVGLVVHADSQLIPIETAVDEVISDYIPEGDREDFFARGSDIYGGNGYFKGKSDEGQEYPFGRRLQMLCDLASLVSEYGLTVLQGHIAMTPLRDDADYQELSPMDAATARVMLAHSGCVLSVEAIMRAWYPDEVAQLVVEDSGEMHRHIKNMNVLMRSSRAKEFLGLAEEASFDLLPLRKIVNNVHFSGKRDSRALQLADVCAYLVRGNYMSSPRTALAYEAIKSAVRPSIFGIE